MYKGGPHDEPGVIEALSAMNGHVWQTSTAFAAGGTGTSRVSIETHRVPDAARMLLGWQPTQDMTTPAVAQSQQGFFDIIGTNYKFQPQQVLSNGESSILSVGAPCNQLTEYYSVFAPVAGGETWDIGYTPLVSQSGNSRVSTMFYWTDVRLPLPVIYSQAAATTAVGTAAGNFAGGALNINNAHMLVEVFGQTVNNAAVAAGKGLGIQTTMTCTVWKPVQQIVWNHEQVPSPVVTSGSVNNWVGRRYERIEFLADRATISTTFNLDQATTTAGNAVQGIRWI